jgi:hypothetical protein
MLIKSFSEVRLHFTDSADNSYENILPFLKRALRKLVKIVPQALYDIADAHHNPPEDDPEVPEGEPEVPEENTPSDDQLDELVFLMQSCLVYYAYYLRLPLNNGTLTESGLQQTWNDKARPMRAEEAKEYRYSILFLFHDSVEALIGFLNENSSVFPSWSQSAQKTKSQGTLFRHANDFSSVVPIDDSARFFQTIMPDIEYAHNSLKFLLGDDLDVLLAHVHADTVPAESDPLLVACREYCAKYAISYSLNRLPAEDFPACLHGSVVSPKVRDALSLEYRSQANVVLKQVALIHTPPTDDEISSSVAYVKSRKGLSI